MRLRALELQGFKSFPDKTLLHFDASISAVVGPNGSGKSNLSDAIRWVLGEQSSRALRGGKMEDVIFGGTKQRKALGFAEVTLTLDNEDGALPHPEPELSVTRRYYRSGDSEYYINRRLMRLRDVNELFMDTGLGQEGYALIGQGRIDEILSVKSSQRREIFEEAAGISRYRHRKEEAERKLAHTRDNLLRIRDKLEELELQLKPLAVQAEKAKRYFRCRDELRVLEVSVWMQRLAELRTQHTTLQAAYNETKVRLEAEQAESRRLYDLSETLLREAQEKDVQLETLRRREMGLEEESAICLQQISVLQVQMENHRESLQKLARETELREERRTLLAQQTEEKQEALRLLLQEAEAAKRQRSQLEEALRDAQTRLQEARQQRQALQDRAEQEAQAAHRVQSLLSVLEASTQELLSQATRLSHEQAELEARLTEAQAQLALEEQEERAQASCLDALRKQTQDARQALQAAQCEEQRAQETWVSLRMEENALAARVRMLEEMQSLYEGYAKSVKSVMEQAERGALRGVHGPVASLVHVPERYALAVEIALGGAAQNLIVETEHDGKMVLADLKRRDAGRVTCLPLDAVRGSRLDTHPFLDVPGYLGLAAERVQVDARYEGIVNQLLGKVLLASDLDAGLAMARQFGYRYRIVTLDGQVLAPGGAMTGGSSLRRGGIITRATELDGLREKQQALRARRIEAESLLDTAKEQARIAEQATEAEGEHVQALEQQLSVLGARRLAQVERETTLREQLARYDADRQALRLRQDETDAQATQARARLEQMERSAANLVNAQQEAEQGLQACVEACEALVEQIREQTTAQAVRSAEQRALTQTLADLESRRDALQQDAHGQENERQVLEAALLQMQTDCKKHEQKWETLQQKKEGLRAQLTRRSNEKLALEGKRARIDREGREKNDILLHSQRELVLLEQKKMTAEQEEARLLEQLWEQYELSHEAARAIAQPPNNLQQAERSITALRGELRSLGQVNLGAVEEYARVRERFDYLDTQKRDVEESDQQLCAIIEDLTGQMRDIFRREFVRINEAFGESFSALFGGGSAHLQLEDERDILNCGIEIHVSPPGKSLRTLSLLSGGEKALCAIAIYFAILKIRPTPFCVLDEIEAALDDANVLRFAHYLRSMAVDTQFIVITHRRGTMEEADLLYGVTMQQQGVSQLLRLRLGEADALIADVAT